MLLFGSGIKRENRYVCSHWVSEGLETSGIVKFNKNLWDMRPLDYYDVFEDKIVYEGLTMDYDERKIGNGLLA